MMRCQSEGGARRGSGTLRFVNIFSYALITARQINLALHKTQWRAQEGTGQSG